MKYDDKSGLGKIDRSFDPVKVNFDGEASYDIVRDKCQRIVWGQVKGAMFNLVHLWQSVHQAISHPPSLLGKQPQTVN